MNIVLVRHGKPERSQNIKLNAAGYTNWIRHYDHSLVCPSSRPEIKFTPAFDDFYIVSSDLPRALHSSQIAFGTKPNQVSAIFREMEIPRYKLPFNLKTWTWLYLSRVLWTLGLKGRFESYRAAKLRAKQAASELIRLANKHDKVILFAHGYLNFHIRKELRNQGWQQIEKSNAYWGISSFEITTA